MKNDSYEIFVEQLRSVKFPDCSNHLCVNDTYQNFLKKFSSVVEFVGPIRTLKSRVKSNSKPWFDLDVLNAIWNREKGYKKFKRLGKNIDKGNFKWTRLFHKKQNYFEVKIAGIRIILKNSSKL